MITIEILSICNLLQLRGRGRGLFSRSVLLFVPVSSLPQRHLHLILIFRFVVGF